MPRKVTQDLLAGSDTETETITAPVAVPAKEPPPEVIPVAAEQPPQIVIPKKRRPTPSDELKAKMKEGRIRAALERKERMILREEEVYKKLERLDLFNYIDDDTLKAALTVARLKKEQETGIPCEPPTPRVEPPPKPAPVLDPPKRKYVRRQPLPDKAQPTPTPTPTPAVTPTPKPTPPKKTVAKPQSPLTRQPKIIEQPPPLPDRLGGQSDSDTEPDSEYTTNPDISSTSESESDYDRMPISSFAQPSINPSFMLYRGRRMGR